MKAAISLVGVLDTSITRARERIALGIAVASLCAEALMA
jgi:hypothetical protein